MDSSALRARQRLGKYKVLGRLADTGLARVYRAQDTVEGLEVAIKVPYQSPVDRESRDAFVREMRLVARLDHPNVLAVKEANIIDDRFVVVTRMGLESLEDRLGRRLSLRTGLELSEQILAGLAHAHALRVVHCDIKPANFILFPEPPHPGRGRSRSAGLVRLNDFGISRLAFARNRSMRGSGSGTVGYVAPEQAMGKLSYRSDVFSAALVIWRILSGRLPEWPFSWPLDGVRTLRQRVPYEMVDLLATNLMVPPSKRLADAGEFHDAFVKLLPAAEAKIERVAKNRKRAASKVARKKGRGGSGAAKARRGAGRGR